MPAKETGNAEHLLLTRPQSHLSFLACLTVYECTGRCKAGSRPGGVNIAGRKHRQLHLVGPQRRATGAKPPPIAPVSSGLKVLIVNACMSRRWQQSWHSADLPSMVWERWLQRGIWKVSEIMRESQMDDMQGIADMGQQVASECLATLFHVTFPHPSSLPAGEVLHGILMVFYLPQVPDKSDLTAVSSAPNAEPSNQGLGRKTGAGRTYALFRRCYVRNRAIATACPLRSSRN